jgi:hypothetical protein
MTATMAEPLVPDSIEPIVGRRCWGLAERIGGQIVLCSGHGGTIWPGDQPLEATCAKAHTSPGENCTCGVYALAETEPWPYYSFEGPGYAVWGEVLLWGVVIKASRGFRAQFAYPRSLNLAHKDYRFAGPLRASYPGVPVRLRNPFPEVEHGHRH